MLWFILKRFQTNSFDKMCLLEKSHENMHKFQFWHFWEHPLFIIKEYAFKIKVGENLGNHDRKGIHYTQCTLKMTQIVQIYSFKKLQQNRVGQHQNLIDGTLNWSILANFKFQDKWDKMFKRRGTFLNFLYFITYRFVKKRDTQGKTTLFFFTSKWGTVPPKEGQLASMLKSNIMQVTITCINCNIISLVSSNTYKV